MALSIQEHLPRRNSVILTALIVFCGVAVGVATQPLANAAGANLFTDKLTNPNDVTAGGVDGAVDLHLKKIQNPDTHRDIAKVTRNVMGAYYPKSEGSSPRNKYIKISEGKRGRVCHVANYINGELIVEISVDGANRQYTIPMQQVCRGDNFYGKRFDFPTGGSMYSHASGLYEARIDVYYNGVNYGNSADTNDINYNMELFGGSNSRKLALRKTESSQKFGFRSAFENNPSAASNQKVKAEVPFGFPCSETEGVIDRDDRVVRLYDPDGVFGDTYMWVTKGPNNIKLDKSDYDVGASRRINDRDWDPDKGAWKVPPGDGATTELVIKQNNGRRQVIKPGVEYRLVIYNDGNNRQVSPHYNTLSLSIPHDSIYALPTCDYKLKPTATIEPPIRENQTVSAGTKVPVQGHVAVTDGYDNDDHAWALTAHVFDGAPPRLGQDQDSTQRPCEWRTGTRCYPMDDGNRNFKNNDFDTRIKEFDTTGMEPGDQVCFVMSVKKPNYDSNESHWYHSALECVKVAGDQDGTTVTPSTYSYFPDLAVTSKIMNDGGYPLVDNFMSKDYKRNKYEWKIIEAKFKRLPNSIGIAAQGDCTKVQTLANYLNGTCQVVNGGDNLFPNPNPVESVTKRASSLQEGPDPIGTWTCYTASYRKNPEPRQELYDDIFWWERDWNDRNSSSENPSRWGDGYHEDWVPPVYDGAGNLVSAGYWQPYGSQVNGNAKWLQAYNRSPYPAPPQYKFTPYKRSSCSISGVDPKIQVRSHDLQVGGAIDSWIRTITKAPAAMNTVISSYGSNAEYATLSGGVNARMASGSGLIRGSTSPNQSSWSPLTFTNNTSTFGRFSGVLQANRPSASNAEEITSQGQISLAQGTKKVYHVNGTLTINSNLEYPNSYTSVNDIPRVIIIADTIEIGPNVTRIDPWLVAENISTCNSVTTNYNNSPGVALASANLSIGQCSNPLVFNGPVYVSNLYLYRTGGSRIPRSDINEVAGAWGFNPDASINPNAYCEASNCASSDDGDERRYAFSAPAEVFNLRPDAYLSSLSGLRTNKPAAVTDKITELPPRF